MRFAVSLMRLLCAIIAGAVLVAFLYFTNQGAEYHTASTVCMVLFAASLAVWALIAVAGDMWLRKIDDRDFYQKISNPVAMADISADAKSLVAQINENGEANRQTLLAEFQKLGEKVSALKESEQTDNEKSGYLGELRAIAENMQKLQTQIEGLQNVLKDQSATLKNVTAGSGQWETASQTYPKLTEEAAYPESVIDYEQEKGLDIQNEEEEKTLPPDEPTTEITEAFEDEPLESFLDDTNALETEIESEISAQQETPIEMLSDEGDSVENIAEQNDIDLGADDPFGAPAESTPAENIDLPDEPVKIDLGADDPFGAPTELTPAENIDLPDEPVKIDLGADDPFGANVEPTPNIKSEEVFEPEHHTIDLGADNPFGASGGAEIDVNAIEPATNTKKNEPNLDHIFNDELASELADLEILNDEKKDDNDDLDLEQFFASHRKSLG